MFVKNIWRVTRNLRHVPVQERGARRFGALLDAAEAIIVEGGYEALTLTAVAERAGSSIGSLYRFFSEKDQLLEALAQRLAEAIDANAAATPPEPIARLSVDAFVAWITGWFASVIAEHPALPGLLSHFGEYCEPLEERTMAPIDAFLKAHAPALTPKARALGARMALKLIEAAVKLRDEVPGTSERAALEEMRLALTAYLQVKIGRRKSGS